MHYICGALTGPPHAGTFRSHLRPTTPMSLRRSHFLLLTAAAAVVGCVAGNERPTASQRTLTLTPLPSPTHKAAAEPFVSLGSNGTVLLSWLERNTDSSTAMHVARLSTANVWNASSEVVRRRDLFVNWADFPSVVALADGRWLAHWLQKNGSGAYAYDIQISQSSDSGATWSPTVIPHKAGIQAEHGFATLLPNADSSADIVFLNGDVAPAPPAGTASNATHESHSEADGPPMRLGFAHFSAAGTMLPDTVLDARTCDCCQTAIAQTSNGPVVLYRDRLENETRDISVMRRVQGNWTQTTPLHRDNWIINACPVNGPAISADGMRVAAVWFTAARDTAKVQLVFSSDAGATFGAPVRIDAGAPVGRVDVEMLDGGDALVTWIERTGAESAEVRARIVRSDGRAEPAITIATLTKNRASGFPRMVRRRDDVVLAWTMPGATSTIQLASLRIGPR
jgi:hypothetical protein